MDDEELLNLSDYKDIFNCQIEAQVVALDLVVNEILLPIFSTPEELAMYRSHLYIHDTVWLRYLR